MSNSNNSSKAKTLYTEMIKSMMLDYCVNDLGTFDLAKKYNVSNSTAYAIVHTHKFKDKRLKYQEKVLNRSLDKLAERQSSLLSKTTTIMERQIDRIDKKQKKDENLILDNKTMREILNAFSLLAKEYRLDTGKSTDNQVHIVKVEMGSAQVISDNHIINKDKIIEVPTETLPGLIEDKPDIKVINKEENKITVNVESKSDDNDIMVFGDI